MKSRKQTPSILPGTATHRRTEGDYMAALLDTVTLADWRDVVAGALNAAKSGDAQARAWLAHYLVGKPEGKAPTPFTVVVQQLNGADPLVERLAKPAIDRARYPGVYLPSDDYDGIKARIAAELPDKIAHADSPNGDGKSSG